MHLFVDYWISVADRPDQVLLDSNAIASFVRNAYDVDSNMVDLNTYPETIESGEVVALIRSISKPYKGELRYREGGRVTTENFDRYTANLNLERVPETVDVRFGMIVERADMRTWPTADIVFESEETIDLDRFQENGLFPGDVVAVLHESSDGLWYFAQSYNYAAWVPKHKVALGERKEILAYGDAEPFLVVAGSRVVTNHNPNTPSVSEVQLEMGTRLPLLTSEDVDHDVDGRNPNTSYIVRLPTRTEQGGLEFQPALLASNQDISVGYLPYTRRNVLNQAFKFLGERYGWGHSFNARDCTGFVLEVHKTFGFKLPRNSGQQGQSEIGENVFFPPGATGEDKMGALAEAEIGDLLYSHNHVMLYLGTHDGEHYVIHDLSGSGWIDDDGQFHDGVLNGVSVTPLKRIHSSPEETYFDQMYSIKRLR